MRKIFDDAHAAPFAEDLLELGTPDQVVVADLLDGERDAHIVFQIISDPAEDLIVAFELGGLGRVAEYGSHRGRIPPDQMDEEMLQIIQDHLLRPEYRRLLLGHVLKVRVVQAAAEAVPCLDDDIRQEVPLKVVDLEYAAAEEIHRRISAIKGDDD